MKIEFEVETEFDRTGLPFGLGNVLPPKAVGVTILNFLPSPL